MKIWEVGDGDELAEWRHTKADAIAAFREARAEKYENGGYCYDQLWLTEYEVPTPITRELVCRMAKGEGWASTVTTLVEWHRDKNKRSGFFKTNTVFK